MKSDYQYNYKLKHNEIPAIIDVETGETKSLKFKQKSTIPPHQELFEPNASFTKTFSNSWRYLDKVLEPYEYKAAHKLALKAKAFTNSLEPLNDDTIINDLVSELGISKNRVKPVLQKLFDIGVYGKFEVAQGNEGYKKYWILNPYLSFNGKLIDSAIANLFRYTKVAKAFRGEIDF